jgi:Replication-relaxation
VTRSVETPTRDRARARPRTDRLKLQSIAVSLTERDQRICIDLFEHRILTTIQLYELHFQTYPRARKRLLDLYRLGLVWRTRPPKHPGSFPWHYVLDEPGALIVADSQGIERGELTFRFDKVLGIIDSHRLRHLRETNGFFTRLAYACRTSDRPYRLAEWWGERTCIERWQGLVRPDGLGRLDGPDGSLRFALELDRGTESRDRLAEKLERYALIASGPEAPDVVLFCFAGAEREHSAREVLIRPGVAVATTSLERHRTDALGPVWRSVGEDSRKRLIDLMSVGRFHE